MIPMVTWQLQQRLCDGFIKKPYRVSIYNYKKKHIQYEKEKTQKCQTTKKQRSAPKTNPQTSGMVNDLKWPRDSSE